MIKNKDNDTYKSRTVDKFYFVDNDKIIRILDSLLIVEKTLMCLAILMVVIMYFNDTYESNAEFLVSLPVFIYIAYAINKFIFRKTNQLTTEIDSCLLYDKNGVLWKIDITQLNKDYKYGFTKDTFKNPVIINQSRLSNEENTALRDSILRAIGDYKYNMNFYGAINKNTYIIKYNNIKTVIRTSLSYVCRYKDDNNISRNIKIHRIYKDIALENANIEIGDNNLKLKRPKTKKYHFHIVAFKVFIYSVFIIIAKYISIVEILRDIIHSFYR